MHQRFGRPAQQKIKDRWGGGLVLATILALLAAYVVGDWIGNKINSRNQTAGTGNKGGTQQVGSAMSAEPGDFQLRFVQVGAFRSKANYMAAVREMHDAGLSPVVGVTKNNITPVYVGPFMDKEAAETAQAEVQALKKDYEKATIRELSVTYNAEALPVATGIKQSDLKKGMDLLNMYLQEVSMWMENPGANDTAALAESGKGLSDLAAVLSDSKDARVKEFANLASAAAANATTIEGLSNVAPTDAQYQAAMAQYMGLVDHYMTFQGGK